MINKSIAALVILLPVFFTTGCRTPESDLEKAIAWQLEKYPASRLQDIYKSFFQDRFGPGHLLEDTAAAKVYLFDELALMSGRGRYGAEPCGLGENFYRVPLDLVKDGKIDAGRFYDIFVQSSRDFRLPDDGSAGPQAGRVPGPDSLRGWITEWERINSVIEKMNTDLPGYEEDSRAITAMLDRGEYVVHHSQEYLEAYDPHYRILRKEYWSLVQQEIDIKKP
jgi:hypothetical protein